MRVFSPASTATTAFLSLQRRSDLKLNGHSRQLFSQQYQLPPSTRNLRTLCIMAKEDGDDGLPSSSRLQYQRHDREEDVSLNNLSQHSGSEPQKDQDVSLLFNVISHVYDDANLAELQNELFPDETSRTSAPSSIRSIALLQGAISSLGDIVTTSSTQMLLKKHGRGCHMIAEHEFHEIVGTKSSDCHKLQLTRASLIAAQSLRNLLIHYGPGRGMGRKALMTTIAGIDDLTMPSNTLAKISLVSALSICNNAEVDLDILEDDDAEDQQMKMNKRFKSSNVSSEDYRHASRAAVSGLLPNGRHVQHKQNSKVNNNIVNGAAATTSTNNPSLVQNNFGGRAVGALLDMGQQHSSSSKLNQNGSSRHVVDLHIVTGLARAFVTDNNTSPTLSNICANVIRQTLRLHETSSDSIEAVSNHDTIATTDSAISAPEIDKKLAAATFGLAAEIGPWNAISCVDLVNLSIDMSLWHAAERLCTSAVQHESDFVDSSDAHDAVHTLIDRSFEQHLFRQADTLATQFYHDGGRSRFVEARFLHACSTISKVVLKRQFPIIERQIERVDKAIDRVQRDIKSSIATNSADGQGEESVTDEDRNDAKVQVREFALTRLREVNEHDTAHRLAVLWNMTYWYDLEDTEKYVQLRRERYIQWDEAFSSSSSSNDNSGDIRNSIPTVPEVIGDAEELKIAFQKLSSTIDDNVPVVGFDVEWGDESEGAALLQLSTLQHAILIDVPALSTTTEGCQSLEQTVGKLFGGSSSSSSTNSVKMFGFSCRQDLSRLRNSPCTHPLISHWFPTRTDAVIDIKPLIALDTPKIKELGLSRVSEHYLGKLLDKAEQCSQWEKRPLSESQRVYAALDAWAVAAIYSKLSSFTKSLNRI